MADWLKDPPTKRNVLAPSASREYLPCLLLSPFKYVQIRPKIAFNRARSDRADGSIGNVAM